MGATTTYKLGGKEFSELAGYIADLTAGIRLRTRLLREPALPVAVQAGAELARGEVEALR